MPLMSIRSPGIVGFLQLIIPQRAPIMPQDMPTSALEISIFSSLMTRTKSRPLATIATRTPTRPAMPPASPRVRYKVSRLFTKRLMEPIFVISVYSLFTGPLVVVGRQYRGQVGPGVGAQPEHNRILGWAGKTCQGHRRAEVGQSWILYGRHLELHIYYRIIHTLKCICQPIDT